MLCVPIGARDAAHRGSRWIAPAPARRARERPARRPLPSASACGRSRRGPVAAVLPHWSHAAQVAFQMVALHARCHYTCRGPRARGVVSTLERHSGRAMGAAFTRPTAIVSGSAHARRTAFAKIQRPIGALWVRHADIYPQADTPRSPVRTMRRHGVRRAFSHLVSLGLESVFPRLRAGVTLVTPPG